MTKLSSSGIENSPTTLEDVLYANTAARNTEQEWVTLVESIAAGDQLALHALYQRSHRVVFTLIMRITANRETAEEVTIDVFHDIIQVETGPRSGGQVVTVVQRHGAVMARTDGNAVEIESGG